MLGTFAPMWLSDIGVSTIVAGSGEQCWCGCQHASSRRWLIWIWSKTQEAHRIRQFASITWDQYNSNTAAKPTFFLWVSWLCRHISGTILHRWPAWLKTSLCTSPLRSHTCGVVTCELRVKGSVAWCRLICADLLYPRIKLVKELLRDVGCIPRHSYHGADACNTCQRLVKWPRQWLRSHAIFHEMTKCAFF